MPIRTETCYVAYCDDCDEAYENGDGYFPHSPTAATAREEAENGDWRFWKDKCWCEPHVPLCRCGHLLGVHDYGEAPCEDCTTETRYGAYCCQAYDPAPAKEEEPHAT